MKLNTRNNLNSTYIAIDRAISKINRFHSKNFSIQDGELMNELQRIQAMLRDALNKTEQFTVECKRKKYYYYKKTRT
jgi:hypothetical protein